MDSKMLIKKQWFINANKDDITECYNFDGK